jgi:anti-anti-sigma regulatory factor
MPGTPVACLSAMTAIDHSPTHGGADQPASVLGYRQPIEPDGVGLSSASLCLIGRLNYVELAGVLRGLLRQDQHRVVIDCTHVDRLRPVELRTLVRYADQCAARGGYLRLIHVNPGIRRLIEIFHYLELLDNRNQARSVSRSANFPPIVLPPELDAGSDRCIAEGNNASQARGPCAGNSRT